MKMSFIAAQPLPPEPKDATGQIIKNSFFWPDVDLGMFRRVMRSDGTVTPERLKQLVLTAIAEVNAELYAFKRRSIESGYHHLTVVPAEMIDEQSERVHHYFNAIFCWTQALINERYSDFDATASGGSRAEELSEASNRLWRDAQWAIASVQDKTHCIIELI